MDRSGHRTIKPPDHANSKMIWPENLALSSNNSSDQRKARDRKEAVHRVSRKVTLIYHSLFASKSNHPTIPDGHNSLAGEDRDGTTLTDEFVALMTGLPVSGITLSATLASDQHARRARQEQGTQNQPPAPELQPRKRRRQRRAAGSRRAWSGSAAPPPRLPPGRRSAPRAQAAAHPGSIRRSTCARRWPSAMRMPTSPVRSTSPGKQARRRARLKSARSTCAEHKVATRTNASATAGK
jgi:hypothetical protein